MAEASEQMDVAAEAGVILAKRGRASEWPPERREEFLRALEVIGSPALAAMRMGATHHAVYNLRQREYDFRVAWDIARQKFLAKRRQLVIDAGMAAEQRMAEFERTAEAAVAAPATTPPAAERTEFDGSPEACRQFLMLLTEHGGIKTAARAMGVSTESVYAVRETNKAFRAAWDRAALIYTEVAESELMRQAVDGGGRAGRGGDVKTGALLVEKARAELRKAKAAEALASGPVTRAAMEASRHELEGRLASLIERFGDPFGEGDATPGEVAA